MTNLFKQLLIGCSLTSALAVGSVAYALDLSPANATHTSNLNSGNDLSFFPAGFELLYKQNEGGGEEGGFSDDYTTVINAALGTATITYVGPDSIDCGICWLVVKDGSAEPARYFFNLSETNPVNPLFWNGTDTLNLSGFWPGDVQGAISHIGIYGIEDDGGVDPCEAGDPRPECQPPTVPEPGTLALTGLAVTALALARRRRRQ